LTIDLPWLGDQASVVILDLAEHDFSKKLKKICPATA